MAIVTPMVNSEGSIIFLVDEPEIELEYLKGDWKFLNLKQIKWLLNGIVAIDNSPVNTTSGRPVELRDDCECPRCRSKAKLSNWQKDKRVSFSSYKMFWCPKCKRDGEEEITFAIDAMNGDVQWIKKNRGQN